MSITRRRFLLGTGAGLILPSFFDRAYSYFENHGEPLLIAPKRPGEIMYAWSERAEEGYRLNLGHPQEGPPDMTIREYCLRYGEGDPETWWREEWLCTEDSEPVDMDIQMDMWAVLDQWVIKDSAVARAYSYLETLDIGPQLKGYKKIGGLNFYSGGSPGGGGYYAVDAIDDVSLSLLQQRLNDLETGIKVRMYQNGYNG